VTIGKYVGGVGKKGKEGKLQRIKITIVGEWMADGGRGIGLGWQGPLTTVQQPARYAAGRGSKKEESGRRLDNESGVARSASLPWQRVDRKLE
jgi:hypothetical protein